MTGQAPILLTPGPGGRLDAPAPGEVVLHVRGRCAFRDLGGGRLVFLRQVHGGRIVLEPRGGEEADGMIVRRNGRCPALKLADCASLFMWSRNWLGAAHAGWRGLATSVVSELVASFPEEPEAAFIGPCILPCCYETGEDVRTLVIEACGGRHPPGRLDLGEAVRSQARKAGLACDIYETGLCTRCREDLFHSYRRDGTAARNIAWISG